MLEPVERLYYYKAKLLEVIDGDTIVVDLSVGFKMKMEELHVRFLGLDTPEKHGPSRDEGLKAKAFLEDLLKDTKDLIVNTKKNDSFGRALATVWRTTDPLFGSINQRIIDSGLITERFREAKKSEKFNPAAFHPFLCLPPKEPVKVEA